MFTDWKNKWIVVSDDSSVRLQVFKTALEGRVWGMEWSDGSEVKSTYCWCRAPDSVPGTLSHGSQQPIRPFPGRSDASALHNTLESLVTQTDKYPWLETWKWGKAASVVKSNGYSLRGPGFDNQCPPTWRLPAVCTHLQKILTPANNSQTYMRARYPCTENTYNNKKIK